MLDISAKHFGENVLRDKGARFALWSTGRGRDRGSSEVGVGVEGVTVFYIKVKKFAPLPRNRGGIFWSISWNEEVEFIADRL